MYSMIRPTFPGYAAYPYQGPRLMNRIEGLGLVQGTEEVSLLATQSVLVAPMFGDPVGREILAEIAWHTLFAGAVGAGGGQVLAKKPLAGGLVGLGAGALFHAAFPPRPFVGMELVTGTTPNAPSPSRVPVFRVHGVAEPSGTARWVIAVLGAAALATGLYLGRK